MANTAPLEKNLEDIFIKKAPTMLAGGKKALVQYAPIASLIIGIWALLSAYWLWHWAHLANAYVNLANNLSRAYGGTAVTTSRFSVWVWLGVLVLAVQGVLYLLAYPGLRDHKKQGWNYIYYGILLEVAYGVVGLFTSYNSFGNLVGAVIGAAIGFWLLFQVRSSYLGSKATDKPAA